MHQGLLGNRKKSVVGQTSELYAPARLPVSGK